MHHTSKGIAHIILLLVIVVTAIGGIGYLMYQNGQLGVGVQELQQETEADDENVNSSSPTPDPTADWETFSGEVFSFKYPSSWNVNEEYSEYYGGYATYINNSTGIVSIELTPSQQPYGWGGPQGDVVEKSAYELSFLGEEYDSTEITLNERSIFVDQKITYNNNLEYFLLFGSGYPVNNNQTASIEEYRDELGTIKQILSTFELVKEEISDSTANWETFTNTKFDYLLKHPTSLTMGEVGFDSGNPEQADIIRIHESNQDPLNTPHMNIAVVENPGKSLEETASDYYSANINHQGIPAESIQNVTQTTFLGLDAYTYTIRNKGLVSVGEEYMGYEGIYKVIWAEKDGNHIMIAFTDTSLMNQILSTFEFTE